MPRGAFTRFAATTLTRYDGVIGTKVTIICTRPTTFAFEEKIRGEDENEKEDESKDASDDNANKLTSGESIAACRT